MSRSRSSRRQFLKKTGAAASVALFSGPLLDFLGVTGDAFAATLRPNVKGLTAASPTIVSYKKGILAMQALPATNPLNWNAWANIHGIGPAPPSGSNPLWDTCQHGHWWFLPWHRMYLWYFEQAIRKFSGDPTFALPFWDYTDPTQRALPPMFRTPATGNPLFVSARNATLNAGGMLTASTVNTSTALGFTNFTGPTGSSASFGSQQVAAPNHGALPHGRLETTPHDAVHIAIGGLMGSFGTAARDPIFWLHHANIDRLWDVWLNMGGGRVDPNNKTWCQQGFRFFNPSGTIVSKKTSDVINALAQLGYSYEGVGAVPAQRCGPFTGAMIGVTSIDIAAKTLVAGHNPIELAERASAVSVPMLPAVAGRALTAARDPRRQLVLRIEGIDVTAPPGVIYEVYVGLPAGTKPDPEGPFYVGNLTPFGAEMHHGEFVQAFRVDAAVERLGANAKSVDVTFVPRGPLDAQGRETPVTLTGRVTFKQVRLIEE